MSFADSAEARIERLEAPVKQEFCRQSISRTPFLLQAEAAPALDAAAAQEPAAVTSKLSKAAFKKELAQQRRTGELCTSYTQSRCVHGDNCRFSHDVTAYLAQKGPDLPGQCPFSAAETCPYGIQCRWASKHRNPDPLTKEHVTPAVGEDFAPDPTPAPSAQRATPEGDQWFWRGDGTVPQAVALSPGATIQPTMNVVSKDTQVTLRKSQYDFSPADAVLRELGIKNSLKKRSKRRADDCGKQGLSVIADGDASKKVKTENGASDPAAMPSSDGDVAVPTADVATEPAETSDAAFIAAMGAEPPPSALPCEAPPELGPSGGAEETVHEPRAAKKTIDFRGKTFLAPLTTVGNLPFRRLCKGLGADVTCGEMALATNLLQGHAAEWALLKRHPEEDLFGVQVCGGFGDSMAACAQLIEENCQVDFVDVNFGCPIDVIINKGAGSACLQRPQRIEEIVRSMSTMLTCPLTLKMRKGFFDNQDVAHTLVPKVAQWGAAAVTLHGRSRAQRYSRLADWSYIKQCAAAATDAGIQLVGNGDIMSWQDHSRAVSEAGVATTYVARGALIKPWIFTEIKEQRDWDISASERLDLIKKFATNGVEHWGSDSRGVETTRRFLLEWLSFAHRYVPVGLLEVLPQKTNWRLPDFVGRSDLETLLASPDPRDWIFISEMVLGRAPAGFKFTPKHKATSYSASAGKDGGGGQENG